MGCCENKILSSDVIIFPEKTEAKKESFDSISLCSEDECKELAETTNIARNCLGYSADLENAFLLGYRKSKTQSLIIDLNL